MFTDPQRIRKNDVGHPEICNVFTFHKLYGSEEEALVIEDDCRRAAVGCTSCKANLAARLAKALQPYQERQDYYRNHPEEVMSILEAGERNARAIAQTTMAEVRDAIKV